MLVSKNWLQKYFNKDLPNAEKIADLFNLHIFEVESVKSVNKDEVFDIKVLPDRACYALNHRNIAKELSILLNTNIVEDPIKDVKNKTKDSIKVNIKDGDICRRYVSRYVKGVKIAPSPKWLKDFLETIGERSINNIVDIANFIMFDLGQPLHAFDKDKVEGEISIRLAKKGEKMITLDNKELELSDQNLIIADEKGPLALAGIKGGKRAEVSENTKNLILESANFDPVSIRKTSIRLKLKTEASKRFEASISAELSIKAMQYFSSLIEKTLPEASFGEINDIYTKKDRERVINISRDFINQILGIDLKTVDIVSILERMGKVEINKEEIVFIPDVFRNDLNIKEDLVEEIGRIYGYEKMRVHLPYTPKGKTPVNRQYYFGEKIKDILIDFGFNEVSLYSFGAKGLFEIEYPLAEDKKFLRENLSFEMNLSLIKNIQNVAIFARKDIRLFEIGNIFSEIGERRHLCIGCKSENKKNDSKDLLNKIVEKFKEIFKKDFKFNITFDIYGFLAEIDITDIFNDIDLPYEYEFKKSENLNKKFESFSVYPFIVRDIAVFVPKGVSEGTTIEIIRKFGGEYLLKVYLFDRFEKKLENGEEKTSYAYRIIFQSMDKTLRDDEIVLFMEEITKQMNSNKGWQVR